MYDRMCVTGSEKLIVRVRVTGRGEKRNKTKHNEAKPREQSAAKQIKASPGS